MLCPFSHSLKTVFPGRFNSTMGEEIRSAGTQAAYQAATVGTTLAIAIFGGLITGKGLQ